MRDGVFSDAAGLPPELQAVQVPGPASVEVEVEIEVEIEPEVEGSATASAAAEIEAGPAVETETETEAETAEPGLLQQEPTKHSARPEQMPHLPAGNTVS